ncbi:MAG TPA: hypothetical protein VIL74_07795 [Pyrinomonadaceae bacterium]|jgi:hypothetical protein
MNKFLIVVILCLAICGRADAQTTLSDLEKIKQIKLLESTREDVRKIFAADQESSEDEDSEDENIEEVESDHFSTDNVRIGFRYSLGNCSDDEEEWNVPNGKVTEINVILKESVKPEDLRIDLSKLERIRKNEPGDEEEEEDPDEFVYFDRGNDVSYGLSDGEIRNVKFTPSEKNFPALCANETLREFTSNNEWLLDKIKRRPYAEVGGRPFANIAELTISKNEIVAECSPSDAEENLNDSDDYFKIAIATRGESTDPTDVLTYNYSVTGGKIVGSGTNVTWDLSGVKPGKYYITAGVDNGCGVCGTTRTEEVLVKECPGNQSR